MDATTSARRPRTRATTIGLAAAAVAATGLLLAGCGDPDGGATPAPTSTVTPTLPPETPGAPLPPGTPVPGEPGEPEPTEPGEQAEPEPTVTSTERLDPGDFETIPPQR